MPVAGVAQRLHWHPYPCALPDHCCFMPQNDPDRSQLITPTIHYAKTHYAKTHYAIIRR